MSTLAHVFEAAGLATVALGSIRNQMAGTAPPRALWCDFPLGRPLGRPDDPEFQHRVLEQAFSLLVADGPVLEDFPETVMEDVTEALRLPMPPYHDSDAHPAVGEARSLRQAYDRAVERFGNRMGAVRVVQADGIPDAVGAFVRIAEGIPWKEAGVPGTPARVAQDIRGYYEMAALGLMDHAPGAWAAARWFLEQTEAGKALLVARTAMKEADASFDVWFYLTPGDR